MIKIIKRLIIKKNVKKKRKEKNKSREGGTGPDGGVHRILAHLEAMLTIGIEWSAVDS